LELLRDVVVVAGVGGAVWAKEHVHRCRVQTRTRVVQPPLALVALNQLAEVLFLEERAVSLAAVCAVRVTVIAAPLSIVVLHRFGN
jgi:hypothetical protein